ncbi:serine/threonine-protein kinase [Streptomyces sp. NPDC058145]|uniref:serine/threonine-protein kinase n=1 Tax=Streptomyces sp. NPDC058145 TaxID=3346356 RepID=UPI0036EE2844
MLHVPLHRGFRYIHEPLPVGDTSIPVLGHEELVGLLRERLVYSHGGTFLITGFRGVGKTTLVLRALTQALSPPTAGGPDERRPDHDALLTVHLSVARRMEPDQLLFALVRRIFETLDDQGLFERLPPEIQESLLLAYTRTSLSFTQTQSEGSERGGTLGVGFQRGPLAAAAPTLSMTGKRTRSRTTEAAFLAYSETDVEHDLVRIIQLLSGRDGRPARRGLLRRPRPRLRIHPVVVLDEIDKLTDDADDAIADLERLLGSLKNVLTARGAHFILVAGPDLNDRALTDADRGNGLYESVFAWRMYVPCLWAAPERLVTELTGRARAELGLRPMPAPVPAPAGEPHHTLDLSGSEGEALRLGMLVSYLRFKSRGVPRRLLQELNSLVMWDGTGRPSVHLGPDDWQRVLFYSHLDAIVSEAVASTATSMMAPVPIDDDRWRLGGYHVTEWALRSRGRVFTAEDVTGRGQLDPLLRLDTPTVERLLRHLARHRVLEVVSEPGRPDATVYGNPQDAGVTRYRLTDAYSGQVAGLARHNENERAELRLPAPSLPRIGGDPGGGRADADTTTVLRGDRGAVPQPAPAAQSSLTLSGRLPPITRLADRYEVHNMIGSGGMGAVYQGRDLRTGEGVAIKLMHGHLAEDGLWLARFRREGEIGLRVRHPNIVRTIAAVETPEPALIMELIAGPSLDEQLGQRGTLDAADVIRMGRNLGEALSHLHSLSLSRVDLKPSNIISHPVRGSVIIDLGIARAMDEAEDIRLTHAGDVVGTPAYMAPEQVRSALDADIRSDLYSLGAVIYQCLAGRPLHAGANVVEIAFAILRNPVSVDDLPVSAELRGVLETCLARDPADRYQEPTAFLRALEATPEARELSGPGERTRFP